MMSPSPDAASIERPYGWVVALASLLMMAIAMGATYVVIVALKPIALEFGWPRAVPSLSYSLALFGAGLGGLFMGRWSDRVGMGPPALTGGIMIAAGAVLASGSTGALQLYVAHGLLIGLLGNGAMFGPLVANATRWFDRRRGIAVGIVTCGQSVAGAVWPPVLRYLTETVGWRQTFVYYGVFALCTLVPLSLLLRPMPPAQRDTPARLREAATGHVVGLPAGLVQAMLCLAIVGCCVAMAMPMVHVIAHATDLGYPTTRAAELLSVLLACAVLSRLIYGAAADRIGGLRTLLLGSAGQAVTLATFTGVESLPGLYAVSALFGLAFGGIVPAYALIVRELFPSAEAGWRIATVFFFGTIGMALGGWLGGLIFDLAGGYRLAFLVGVGFNLTNLALVG
ncbi:MAG TPA: MFS transporter, partial [Geminicoccaceae bacterium]|nr:MFS transporter [Geminicoccaceae bacterium]